MDRVFFNGKIYVEREHFEQAMLVQDDRIVRVGSDGEVLAAAPNGCERVDLEGRTVVPGFNDSHLHILMLGDNLNQVALHGCTSMAEVISRGREFLATHNLPAGQTLQGFGWNQDYFTDEVRMPNRYDLDQISTEHPIIFSRACGHAISINSRAIEMLGLTAQTPQPMGGEFSIGENGEPDGLLFERASNLLAPLRPEQTPEVMASYLKAAMDYAASMGVTTAQSNDLSENNYPDFLAAIDLLRQRDAITCRYFAQCSFTDPRKLETFFAEGHIRGDGDSLAQIGSIKMFIDGSLGARTALLRGPYADDPNAVGIKTLPDDLFDEIVRVTDAHNCTVVTHCIGDGAVENCLTSYSRVIGDGPNKNRHGIIHCQITDADQLARIRDLDVCAMVQPIFIHYDMHVVRERVGDALAETSYNFGTMGRMGIHVSYGTDCPVEDLNPFENLYCAVTRRDLNGGEVYLPGECVDIYTAIDNYTYESAYTCFDENQRGRLQPGYLADFVILDADIFTIPAEQIKAVRPVATYLGGRAVYQR